MLIRWVKAMLRESFFPIAMRLSGLIAQNKPDRERNKNSFQLLMGTYNRFLFFKQVQELVVADESGVFRVQDDH